MIPDFGRYEMYNNDAVQAQALISADFIRYKRALKRAKEEEVIEHKE